MLRRFGIKDSRVVLVCSMAKAFGVPLAVLSGPAGLVERYEERSETRVHCSPPATATLYAAKHALDMNRKVGDAARFRLAQLVRHFRRQMKEKGLASAGGLFPVQTLTLHSTADAPTIHERLLGWGIRSVLTRSREDSVPRLSFLITSRHSKGQLERATDVISFLVSGGNSDGGQGRRPPRATTYQRNETEVQDA